MSKKAAILDSDFTIKTALTKNSKGESLADIVLKLPYTFYCHEQNKKELSAHQNTALIWLKDKIDSNIIDCLSDFDILSIIQNSYSISRNNAIRLYADRLKLACEIFSATFYEKHYSYLEELKNKIEPISDDEFISAINTGDSSVGRGNNLGEIKDILLSIVLNQCSNIDCIFFCSDDNRARRNILAFTVSSEFTFKSISYMGFYWVAKNKKLLTRDEEIEFLSGWKHFCQPSLKDSDLKVTIKEHISRKQPDYPKENIDDLFSAIWDDKVVMLDDGYLVYKYELKQ